MNSLFLHHNHCYCRFTNNFIKTIIIFIFIVNITTIFIISINTIITIMIITILNLEYQPAAGETSQDPRDKKTRFVSIMHFCFENTFRLL